MTPAEIFMETLKRDGKPERQLKQYEALQICPGDPLVTFLRGNRKPGTTSVDKWGTTILFPKDAPGATPHITPENKVCKDITRWRDYCHAPDLVTAAEAGDWGPVLAKQEAAHQAGKLSMVILGTGIFEQCHFLMGFEDTLTNLYEHPQEMHELIDYIFEYRLTYVKLLCKYMHPDIILSHDDWGTKAALFMQPDVWREFFKEPYRKFYAYIRSQGIPAVHHADSYLVPIIEDMIEIGIQAWQGALPENDIPKLLKQIDGRMTLIGGVGAVIDRPDSTEEEIRAYVKNVLETDCPYGHFIPCITYGAPGTVFKHVDPVIDSEIDRYNALYHIPGYRNVSPARRVRTRKAPEKEVKKEEAAQASGVLEQLSAALQKGKKKKVMQLCEEALAQGYDAQTILTDGLVAGMTALGEDFSANRVFVPEMLMAARCMSNATEMLKSRLAGRSSETIGRVCLGTVKGDLHDIGKNLVKIMMEGSGLEVIDLGSDVSADTFVETAIEKQCDLIACSSLLTTTMNEMRRVVELCREKGIRDRVTIMVGGAPISQSFCDEIGADLYTVDAAGAARAAVEAIRKAV